MTLAVLAEGSTRSDSRESWTVCTSFPGDWEIRWMAVRTDGDECNKTLPRPWELRVQPQSRGWMVEGTIEWSKEISGMLLRYSHW